MVQEVLNSLNVEIDSESTIISDYEAMKRQCSDVGDGGSMFALLQRFKQKQQHLPTPEGFAETTTAVKVSFYFLVDLHHCICETQLNGGAVICRLKWIELKPVYCVPMIQSPE